MDSRTLDAAAAYVAATAAAQDAPDADAEDVTDELVAPVPGPSRPRRKPTPQTLSRLQRHQFDDLERTR